MGATSSTSGCTGWDAYLGRLLETFPAEERGIRTCVRVLRRVAAELDGSFPVGVRQVAAFPRRAPLATTVGSLPLARLYGSCRLSEPVRAVLSGESGAYAAPPSRVPVSLHAAFLDHYLKAGAYYPRGGGQVLAARLVEVVEAYDGEVRTGTSVERILVAGGRVGGVRTREGVVHRSPVVVSNTARMALPMFSVYLGLDVDVATDLPNTSVFSHPHTDIEATYQDYDAGRLPDELPFFLASATVKDPGNLRIAPPGHPALELMTVVPAGSAFWGLPASGRDGLAYPTPITHQRFTGATGGACYGWELSTRQVGLGRPGPSTEIGGLFLAGASTRWCHGVMGVMNGGLGTAAAVLGRDLRGEVLAGRRFGDPARLATGGPAWDPLVASRGQRRSGRVGPC